MLLTFTGSYAYRVLRSHISLRQYLANLCTHLGLVISVPLPPFRMPEQNKACSGFGKQRATMLASVCAMRMLIHILRTQINLIVKCCLLPRLKQYCWRAYDNLHSRVIGSMLSESFSHGCDQLTVTIHFPVSYH